MLGSRNITPTTALKKSGGICDQRLSARGSSKTSTVKPGYGQTHKSGCYRVGYADDTAILVNGQFPNTVSELLQEALDMVQQWYDDTQLSISPQKMVVVPFTKKRNLRGLKTSLDKHCSLLLNIIP